MARRQQKKKKNWVLSFRVPEAGGLIAQLDRYVAELAEGNPGGNWTRSSAAMNAITLFLRDRYSKGEKDHDRED